MTDHFVPIPLRFFEALTAGELDAARFIVGALIAHRRYEIKNTAHGVATFRLKNLADLCDTTDDTIVHKLEDLQQRGWINFERPKQGQRSGWRIWLTELAWKDDPNPASPPHDLRTTSEPDPLPIRRSSSEGTTGEDAATPHGQRVRSPARPPQNKDAEPTNETRRDDKRTTKSKPLSDGEKKDHVLGKTTGADQNGADGDRLLTDAELMEMAQAETRRRHEAGEW